VAAKEKGTAFRRTSRSDLDWIFTIQTERVVAKDNTVAIADRNWLLEKSRFRSSLVGCTVTIHEHLDGNVSIRYGPTSSAATRPRARLALPARTRSRRAVEKAGPWRRWKTTNRFPTVSTAPWESRNPSGIPTFPPLRLRFPSHKANRTDHV
jgi:hypothetical protein